MVKKQISVAEHCAFAPRSFCAWRNQKRQSSLPLAWGARGAL